MDWLTVPEVARKWDVTEQTIRFYCREGIIPDAVMHDRTWYIPSSARRPRLDEWHTLPPPLLQKLLIQKHSSYRGIYNYLQINMAYSSSRMASNRLTRNHVEYLFKKGKLLSTNESMKLNDFIEVRNHFLCVDYIIDEAMRPLRLNFITELHGMLFSDICGHKFKPQKSAILRSNTPDSESNTFVPPEKINQYLFNLFSRYEKNVDVRLLDIIKLHVQFERIRPFADGNGRIGRLIMLKECLRHNIMPFIIDDKKRFEYLRGITDWETRPGLLLNVCKECQTRFSSDMETAYLIDTHSRMMRQIKRD